MSECMTQEDAMNMSTEQAIRILKPMQSMMRDQNGCPISDAYFALEKAIEALEKKVDAVERKKGEWIKNEGRFGWHCSECKVDNYYAYVLNSETGKNDLQDRYCPNCGADMRGEQE